MSNERTIAELEDNISEFEARIEFQEKLVKLQEVPEFKEIVTERFLKDEAVRLVMLRGSDAASDEIKADCLHGLDAIGWLNSMFSAIHQMGNHARRSLPEAQAALSAVLSGAYDEETEEG